MKRPIIYSNEIPRDYDHLKGWRWQEIDSGLAALDMLGGYSWGPPQAAAQISGPSFGNSPIGAAASAGFPTGAAKLGGFTAPSGNVGGAGGTNSTGPSLYALINGATLSRNVTAETGKVTISVDVGTIYLLAPVDASAAPSSGAVQTADLLPLSGAAVVDYSDVAGTNTAVGVGAADQTTILARVVADAATLNADDTGTTMSTPGAGLYSSWLIYALPISSDMTDVDDPWLLAGATEALIAYYDSASPGSPWSGPGGDGIAQGVLRAKYATYKAHASTSQGVAAATTTVAGLTLPAGGVPLYILVANSSTTLATNADSVWAVNGGGPAPAWIGSLPAGIASIGTPSNLQYSGWLAGHLQQHHLGLPGHAPKIDGGTEWAPLSAVYNDTTGGSGTGASVDFFNARDIYVNRAIRASGLNKPTNANAPSAPTTSSTVALDANASDVAGKITYTVGAGGLSILSGASSGLVGTLDTASGLVPETVAFTPLGYGFSWLSSGLVLYWAPNSTFGWGFGFLNPTANTITVPASTVYDFSYLAIY